MPVRETHKDIELNGRKFRLTKFDAQTGSYIGFQILMAMVPGGIENGMKSLEAGRPILDRKTFMAIQADCLGVCYEIQLDQFPVKVLLADGRWGVDGLDTDTPLVMALTIHALLFNINSFFEAPDAMTSLFDSLASGLNLPSFLKPGATTPSAP